MQEYLVMLLVILLLISLVLVASHSFFKSRIHLRTRTVFATIGVSFLLGTFFPWVLSTFALSVALLVYLGVITLFAFALSYCDIKIPAHAPANQVITTETENEIAEPAPSTSPVIEFNEKIAFTEACAILDCTATAAEAENNIVPTETMAADLPEGITPAPVQECASTSEFTKAVAGETESPPKALLQETETFYPNDLLRAAPNITELKTAAEDMIYEFSETEKPIRTVFTDVDTPTTAGNLSDETQPDTKAVPGGGICTNSTATGGAHLQSTQDTSGEWSLPVSESTPETGWLEETREPAKASSAATDATEEYRLAPGQDDVAYDAQKNSQQVILEEKVFTDEKFLPILKAVEEHFERCDLPAMELSAEMNAAIPAEKTPAARHAPMDDTSMAEGLPADAEAAYTSESSGELTKDHTAGGTSKPAAKSGLPPETVNDNISAGFAAKASGDMASALVSFMNAFSLNQEPHAALALGVEISNVYQELGHYPQAKLFIKSLLEQEHFNVTPMRQQLEDHLLYLETLTELLHVARMPNAPYSKVPNLVKLKANIDTAERQKK